MKIDPLALEMARGDKGIQQQFGLNGNGNALSGWSKFDGLNNGSLTDLQTGLGTAATIYRSDFRNNLLAYVFSDGTTHYVAAATVSGVALTAGAKVTISGTSNSQLMDVCVLSASLIAVLYTDSGANRDAIIKTYSVSGATLTLDQTLTIATGAGGGAERSGALAYAGGNRMVCAFQNTSGYLAAIGVTATAGALSKDGSSVVVESASTTSYRNKLSYMGATGKVLLTRQTSGVRPRYNIITDGGSPVTVGSDVSFGNSTAGAGAFCACSPDGKGVIMLGAGTQAEEYNGMKISAGSVTDSWLNGTTAGSLVKWPTSQRPDENTGMNYACMGDVDGDGTIWGVQPAAYGNSRYSQNEGPLVFVAFKTAKAPAFYEKPFGTTLTGSGFSSSSSILQALDTERFVAILQGSSNTIKAIVAKK